jgi:RNA polymerase sigma-70 factor (ECF subfamily)
LQEKQYQEQEAFLALQKGEERGLDFFFNLYYSQLVYFSLSYTNNKCVSQEIVSDTFIKLWKKQAEITECQKIKFLLYRIVRNASINYLRDENSRKQRSAFLSSEQNNSEGSVLEKLIETETYNHLCSLLSHLPPRCRKIFQMFYFQDKAIKEIAQELGISVNTVKTQKQRALQMLRENQGSLSQSLIILFLFI